MKKKYMDKKLTVLSPGAMKPFHDGHYSLMKSYAENDDMPVKDIDIIISQKERSGISAQSTFDFLTNIAVRMSHKLGVRVLPEICEEKSPIAASYHKILNPESDDEIFTILCSNKGDDDKRLNSFRRDFSDDGKWSEYSDRLVWLDVDQDPLTYNTRSDKYNGGPISATIARIDVYNDDFHNFLTNYKMMLADNIVTEEELENYFNILKDEVILSKDDVKKMNESNQNCENKYFKNKFKNKMNYNKFVKYSRLWEGEDIESKQKYPRRHDNSLVNESLKARNPKYQDKVDRSERSVAEWVKFFKENKEELKNERKVKEASKNIKSEAKALAKFGANYLNIAGMKDLKRKLAKIDPSIEDFDSELLAKVNEAVASKKLSLHDNIIIEGKSLKSLSTNTIKNYRRRADIVIEKLRQERKDAINEGYIFSPAKRKEMLKETNAYAKLIDLLDEELCYRNAMLDKLIEESNSDSEISATSTAAATDKNEQQNPDEDQTIDVSAIVVEVKEEGKDDFVKELEDAGIPKDSITVIDEENDKEDNSANESRRYSRLFKALLEDEDAEADDNSEGEDLNSEDDVDEQPANADSEPDAENSEPKTVKIRINADYANNLIDVLKDSYNFSDDEIEDYIGGEIVDDDSEDDDNKKSSDSSDDEGLDNFKNALADLNLDDIEDENV